MNLSVKERLVILSILPQEGNRLTWKVQKKLEDDLGFSEEELKIYKLETLENGMVRWDNNGEQEKEIEIGEKANDIIVLALSKLNDQNKLKKDHIDLYDKFVGKGE